MDKAGIITDIAIFMDASDEVNEEAQRSPGLPEMRRYLSYHLNAFGKGDKCQVCGRWR